MATIRKYKTWALLYVPYGSLCYSLIFPLESSNGTIWSDINLYISHQMAMAVFEPKNGDIIELVTMKRAYKPSIGNWFSYLDKLAKNDIKGHLSAINMFRIDMQDLEENMATDPLNFSYFESVEVTESV